MNGQPTGPSGLNNQETPVIVFLSIGSNLGDRSAHLREALRCLASTGGIRIDAVSSLYETDPVGLTRQPDFYNCVIRITTVLVPDRLLTACQTIERQLGRKRTVRWGPRIIDIDILTYDGLCLSSPNLTLPHPRMLERDFVMIPYREITEGMISQTAAVRFIRSDWYQEADLSGQLAREDKTR